MVWFLKSFLVIKDLDKNKVERSVFKTENVDLPSYLLWCHTGHTTDFLVALICYNWFFPIEKAHTLSFDWISTVVLFNLAVMCIFFGGWHYILYMSPYSKLEQLKSRKFNPVNQYEGTDHLQREMLYTTLGMLQSSLFQVLMMHAWASGKVPYISNFWDYPVYNIGFLMITTYWREFHFYWVHRLMHPWRWSIPGIGDVGDILYKKVHKLHHKSCNIGPWSGLSMHPIEHTIYYTCTLLPLLFKLHPLHFLYAKFHADIAPIGGHDGYSNPGGDSTFHYLHHAKYDCNYGVPLVPFDKLFGTWRDAGTEKELKSK